MPVLAAANIKHSFGNDIILDGCAISVEAGERIGIVGRNGGGKTTLLRVLAGEILPDEGTISLQRGARVGMLRQDPDFGQGETLRGYAEGAFDELHRVHRQLDDVFHKMAETIDAAALDRLLKEQVRLEERMEALGGHAVDHKIDAVLHGLGFTDSQFTLETDKLSGGQRNRLALARLLLESPDVLLLDEPTNHLDIEGRIWLETFLEEEYRGAVILISHDRYLLDNVVTRIEEVEQGRLIDYPGNYSDFRELRAERRMVMHRAYEAQQDKFKKEEAYIRRYKAGQRAKQARGRLSKLERAKENTLERPMELATFRMQLPRAQRTGDIVVAARGVSKAYTHDDGSPKVLFKDFDVTIARGERWGIIGPNGAGKTTLVRCLMGDPPLDAGTSRLGSNVKIGYYSQRHEGLDPELTVVRYLQKVILKENDGLIYSEQQARDLAGAFLFSGSEQERDLGTLSGGERSRAVLAGLLASAKNVLVLDEPTNHLDIASAERLEEILGDDEAWDGTMILISHDRALIDATCDHLIVLDGKGGAEIFFGNYTEWADKQREKRSQSEAAEADRQRQKEHEEKRRRAAEEARKKEPPRAPEPRKAKGPYSRLSTEELEKKIEAAQARIAKIDADLCDPAIWKDATKRDAILEERKKLEAQLPGMEEEWLVRGG